MTRFDLACLWVALGLLSCTGSHLMAQESYAISNAVVSDCEGFLTDSGEDAEYGSNEFFVFTVLVPAAEDVPIEITFLEEICIESVLDSLVIYDGPDVGAPVLGVYSGTGFTPPPVVSTSGVVTFAFGSDNSVNLCGFSLAWETLAPPPEPPVAELAQPFACPFSSAQIQFSPPLLCADVDLESLTLLDAPLFEPSVICSGDTATGLLLSFDEPVSGNCSWFGSISLGIRDVCDSLFVFDVPLDLNVSSCPVSIELDEMPLALCVGTCSELTFEATGCLAHDFSFSAIGASLSTAVADDSLSVALTMCVEAGADTVFLDLVATQPSQSGTFSWTWPVESPVWTSPLDGPGFYCSAEEGPVLAASPPGGAFSGDGPVSVLGVVDPSSLGGAVSFSYVSLNGCAIDTSLVFELVDAGEDVTTCLGGAAVALEGNGVDASWSGPYTTLSGLFSPDSLGTWEVVFASATCSDTASVEVILQEPPMSLSPICETAPEFDLPAMSDPGEWTGPGVLDATGAVLPSDIPPGPVTWSYVLTGCAFLATSEILPIAVEPDLVVTCPEQAGFVPAASALPAGGTWTGPGVLANSGFFSPSAAPEAYGLELVYQAPNGCTDILEINNVQTNISPSVFATCAGLEAIELHDSPDIDFAPWCGAWSGAGITSGAGCDVFWDPGLAGPGTHVIHFEANTCSDSIVIEVWPDAVPFTVPDGTIFCELDDPVALAPSDFPVGGAWIGDGVDASGIFYPDAGAAEGQVVWSPPGGCNDTLLIAVEPWAQATIGTLPDPWCFSADTWVPQGLWPASSDWQIDGLAVSGFSMDTLAVGAHELTVSWAGEACSSADTVGVVFQPGLVATLTVADTLLCPETATTAEASSSGGLDGAPYIWSWTHTDFPSPQTTYAPEVSGFLVATVSDGCSDPAADSVWVEVAPVPEWQWEPAPLDCFGEPSVARLEVTPAHFDLAWAGDLQLPEDLVGTDTVVWALSATAGAALPFVLTDFESGCTHDTVLNIPSYSPVSAGFQANPGLGPDSACVPWELAPIAMLDFSSFVQQGVWWAEDEAGDRVWSEVYTEGTSPLFAPPLPGGYTLFLAVENEGGCAAADTAWICVSAPTEWFLPDWFSPNGDGLNDRLRVLSEPLDRFEMQVFNRFGERVAVIDDPAVGWDGRQRGVDAPPGAYGIVLDMTFTTGVELSARATIRLIR